MSFDSSQIAAIQRRDTDEYNQWNADFSSRSGSSQEWVAKAQAIVQGVSKWLASKYGEDLVMHLFVFNATKRFYMQMSRLLVESGSHFPSETEVQEARKRAIHSGFGTVVGLLSSKNALPAIVQFRKNFDNWQNVLSACITKTSDEINQTQSDIPCVVKCFNAMERALTAELNKRLG